ncbi:hypothetical protein JW979_02835 [bacterium]|nr:hypothetical protein [candidate division CSSED10-310 bacterium]
MKRLRLRRYSIQAILVLFMTHQIQAAPDLVSLKKGSEGNRSWAVFQFTDEASIVGVSQISESEIYIHFTGNAQDNDGKRLVLDENGNTMVAVKQMNLNPPVFRVILKYMDWQPVAVLKRSKSVVVAVNDFRLLDKTITASGSESMFPAKLVEVMDQMSTEKKAVLQFDENVNWVGYLKPSYDQIALLFCGVQSETIQNDFNINGGNLTNIRIVTPQSNINCLKVEMQLSSFKAFHIVKSEKSIVYQLKNGETSTPKSTNIAMEESVFQPEEESAWIEEQGEYEEPVPVAEPPAGSLQMTPVSTTFNPESVSGTDNIDWNQQVSFDFPGTSIRDALRLIAATNNLNMVIGSGVTGEVTMSLDNVTLKQALELILHTHNLEYLVEGGVITIKPVRIAYSGGRVTKVYRLRYADAMNVANVVRRIASSDSLVEVFSPEFLEFEGAGQNRKSAAGVGVQGIRRATILVVTDRPEKIKEIDAIINDIDRPPVQIMIESKMVEVSPQTTKSLGIDWDQTLNMFMDGQGLNTSDESTRRFQIGDGADNFGFYGSWKTGTLTSNQYLALMDFLKTKTDIELKLSPKLLAMDNEESSISVGTTVPIPEIQQQMGGSGGTERITFNYKEVNIQLNVVPHVGEGNEITMYVNPIIEEISDWIEYGGRRAPVTSKRAVNSIVTVLSGETIVIGGLVKNQSTTKLKKVFLLGDLPLLGRLFQHEDIQNVQTEVMIFITPTIVES